MWYLVWFIAIAIILYFVIWYMQRLDACLQSKPDMEKEMDRAFTQRAGQ